MSLLQRPLPLQHIKFKETNIHVLSRIWTRNPSNWVAADLCLILHGHQDQQYFASKLTYFSDQILDESQPDQMNIASLYIANNLYWNNAYRKKYSMQHGFSLHCNFQESSPNIKQRLSVVIINQGHQRKIWQLSTPVFLNIRDLSPLHSIHTDSGAHTTPSPIHTRCTAPQVKWPGCEDGQTLVSSARRQLHLYPQHVLM